MKLDFNIFNKKNNLKNNLKKNPKHHLNIYKIKNLKMKKKKNFS